MPTTLETQGNFSQISQIIYDPTTTVGSGTSATRTPFPNNIIPTSRFSSISNKIIPYIPAPTSGLLVSNHAFVNTSQVTDHVWTLKFDHLFSDKNRIAYFQSLDSQLTHAVSDFSGPLGTALGNQYQKPQIFRVNHDYTFSPTILLHTTYGYSSTRQIWGNPAQNGFGSTFGFPLTGDSDATPVISVRRRRRLHAWGMHQGKVNNGYQNNYTTQVVQGLTWVHWQARIQNGLGYAPLETRRP